VAQEDLAGIHVLVVEDTADSRETLRIVLEYCGALVTAAASAEEAKRILAELQPYTPDVLVSDISMPDDGLEVVHEVKAIAEAKGLRVPAIAITAHRGRREELITGGFDDLVEKPFDPIALCGVIRRHAQLQT
jgi:CheY-like chemotaxis protein